jgi:hypothetical protein
MERYENNMLFLNKLLDFTVRDGRKLLSQVSSEELKLLIEIFVNVKNISNYLKL